MTGQNGRQRIDSAYYFPINVLNIAGKSRCPRRGRYGRFIAGKFWITGPGGLSFGFPPRSSSSWNAVFEMLPKNKEPGRKCRTQRTR